MPKYIYKGLCSNEGIVRGNITCANKAEAYDQICSQNLTLIRLSRSWSLRKNKFRAQEWARFFQHLLFLISIPLNILEALKILGKENGCFKFFIQEIIFNLQKGLSFSEALENSSFVIPLFIRARLFSGEKSNNLKEACLDLYHYFEQSSAQQKEWKEKLSYPLFLFVFIAGLFLFMGSQVIPLFIDWFDGEKKPLALKAFLSFSNFLKEYGVKVLLILLVLLLGAIFSYQKILAFKKKVDKFLLKVPFFGSLYQKKLELQFLRPFIHLLIAKISLTDALEIASRSIGNSFFTQKIQEINKNIKNGSAIDESFIRSQLFSLAIHQAIRLASHTGKLGEVLKQTYPFEEILLNQKLKNLFEWTHPILTLMMGLLILLVICSSIGPLYEALISLNLS